MLIFAHNLLPENKSNHGHFPSGKKERIIWSTMGKKKQAVIDDIKGELWSQSETLCLTNRFNSRQRANLNELLNFLWLLVVCVILWSKIFAAQVHRCGVCVCVFVEMLMVDYRKVINNDPTTVPLTVIVVVVSVNLFITAKQYKVLLIHQL